VGAAQSHLGDLQSIASIERAVEALVAVTGRIDVPASNARLGTNRGALDVSGSDRDELTDLNVKGTFFVKQEVARGMVDRGFRRIVMMSSQAAQIGISHHPAC